MSGHQGNSNMVGTRTLFVGKPSLSFPPVIVALSCESPGTFCDKRFSMKTRLDSITVSSTCKLQVEGWHTSVSLITDMDEMLASRCGIYG